VSRFTSMPSSAAIESSTAGVTMNAARAPDSSEARATTPSIIGRNRTSALVLERLTRQAA
jgi:hypothetical protein